MPQGLGRVSRLARHRPVRLPRGGPRRVRARDRSGKRRRTIRKSPARRTTRRAVLTASLYLA